MSLLEPDILSEYESDFLGCRIERLFYFVWRHVVAREYKMLGERLDKWYSEELAAKPGSHKPVERRRTQYPGLMVREESAFAAEIKRDSKDMVQILPDDTAVGSRFPRRNALSLQILWDGR